MISYKELLMGRDEQYPLSELIMQNKKDVPKYYLESIDWGGK